jgi:hypothetical protein
MKTVLSDDLPMMGSRCTSAMAFAADYLDAIVFCGIEEPDRIALPRSEDRRLRLAVDEKLRALILDDDLGILGDTNTIEVTGSVDERLAQVVAELPGLTLS